VGVELTARDVLFAVFELYELEVVVPWLGVAANASATGTAPNPALTTRLRARSGFLIRDLQDFWSH